VSCAWDGFSGDATKGTPNDCVPSKIIKKNIYNEISSILLYSFLLKTYFQDFVPTNFEKPVSNDCNPHGNSSSGWKYVQMQGEYDF
jgi:hypothetical protein